MARARSAGTPLTLIAAVALAANLLAAAQNKDEKPAKALVQADIAELWIDPPADRDLFLGVGGDRLMPDARDRFVVIEIKANGFSDGYTLVDSRKREWSAKFPPEASTEVIASRILWGIGYHQPPAYLLASWRAEGADDPNPQRPARFREKHPDFYGLKDEGPWEFAENPFTGTRQLNALLALQAMLGNSDLKGANNAMYTLSQEVEGARRWYVVRDVGHTFGRTGVFDAPRGDIEAFEREPFIRRVVDGRVEFAYRGRHESLFEHITVGDVEWLCQRLNQLTDRQWQDAFRAGGYAAPLADRFIRRMKAKIAEGLQATSPVRTPS